MEFIIDTSVVIAVITNQPEKESLIEITKGIDLLAPASLHWEIGNAFSAMMKRGRISLDLVFEALDIYRQIPIRLMDVELVDTLRIASDQSIYAYDAYILRCAEKFRAPIITLDKRLQKVALEMNLVIIEVG